MSTSDQTGYEHFTSADRATFLASVIPGHTITVPPDNETGENFVCVATADSGDGGLEGGRWLASIHKDSAEHVVTGDHLPTPIRTASASASLATVQEMVGRVSH